MTNETALSRRFWLGKSGFSDTLSHLQKTVFVSLMLLQKPDWSLVTDVHVKVLTDS